MKHTIVMLTLTLFVSSAWAEIFRDNFNDGDLQGWTFLQGAEDGGIENGELVLGSPKVVDEVQLESEVIIVPDGIIASDYEVSVSLKISKLARNSSDGAAIGLRAHMDPLDPHHVELLTEYFERTEGMERDEKNKAIQLLDKRSYRFVLGNNNHDIRGGLAATIQLMKVSVTKDGFPTIFLGDNLLAFREFDFKLHKWYRLKVIAKGNRFQCFIDDTKMLDFLDDTYTAGGIYLSSGRGNRVHFDDFEVQYEALSVQPRRQLTTTWGEVKGNFHTGAVGNRTYRSR